MSALDCILETHEMMLTGPFTSNGRSAAEIELNAALAELRDLRESESVVKFIMERFPEIWEQIAYEIREAGYTQGEDGGWKSP